VIGLWIAVKIRACSALDTVHGRPLDLLSTNGFGTGRVSWQPNSLKRLVNVYKVRLNVYKIKR